MNKKAQSISINTIVVAAIALLVLVVMIAIFGGRIKIFGSEAWSCVNQGGVDCYPSCSGDDAKNIEGYTDGNIYVNIPGTDCKDDDTNNKCCKLLIEGREKEETE